MIIYVCHNILLSVYCIATATVNPTSIEFNPKVVSHEQETTTKIYNSLRSSSSKSLSTQYNVTPVVL